MNGSDPFASTSKALGRAAERRGQRGGDRNGSGAARNSKGMTLTASFDSSSQPPPVPSRNARGFSSDGMNASSHGKSSRSRGSGGNNRSSREYPSSSSRDHHHSAARSEKSILDVLPPEYRYNPKNAAPVLYHLQKTVESKNGENKVDVSLETLLNAADNDVRLHRARVKAGVEQGESS